MLGEKGVNIAYMNWARNKETGNASVVLRTDGAVDADTLKGFTPPVEETTGDDLQGKVADCLSMIAAAKRPVLYPGYGIHLANAGDDFRALVDATGFENLTVSFKIQGISGVEPNCPNGASSSSTTRWPRTRNGS